MQGWVSYFRIVSKWEGGLLSNRSQRNSTWAHEHTYYTINNTLSAKQCRRRLQCTCAINYLPRLVLLWDSEGELLRWASEREPSTFVVSSWTSRLFKMASTMPGMSARVNGISLSDPWWVWCRRLALGVDAGVAFGRVSTSAVPCRVWLHVVLGVTTELSFR